MNISKIALVVSAPIVSASAWSHGYVESPKSRAYLSQLQEDKDCDPVQYEPQSVENLSGFPTGAIPLDGELASGSKPGFGPLDRQSATDWVKNPIRDGKNTFTWFHKAVHATTNWRYYITKQDWDVNKPLTRDAFESTPFCQYDNGGKDPAIRVNHECEVPERTGYQVIYAVWEIANTANSFYQAIDVDFGDDNGVVSKWSNNIGHLSSKNLKPDDKVIVHFYGENGEDEAKRTEMTIASAEQGDENQWPFDLANQINSAFSDVRVGAKDAQGNVDPIHGSNSVYVKKGSSLRSVAVSYEEQDQDVKEEVTVSGVTASKIANGKATVGFNAQVSGRVTFNATVLDSYGSEKGYVKQMVEDTNQPFSIELNKVQPGAHILKFFATNDSNMAVAEGTVDLQLEGSDSGGNTGDYQFVFPENIASYTAGTVVLQPKNGKVYECKPFPYSGYCVQWSRSANAFEPGVGSNWQDAWILK